MEYLMKCGHVANGKNEQGQDVCTICRCSEIVTACTGTKGLEGRFALCSQHKGIVNAPVPSKWELPLFQYRPNEKYDTYYCGCWGWD